MYERLRINLKVERGLTLRIRVTFHTLSLFYLRAEDLRVYARKNYATVEINPKGREKGEWVRGTRLKVHVIYESYYKAEFELLHINE